MNLRREGDLAAGKSPFPHGQQNALVVEKVAGGVNAPFVFAGDLGLRHQAARARFGCCFAGAFRSRVRSVMKMNRLSKYKKVMTVAVALMALTRLAAWLTQFYE